MRRILSIAVVIVGLLSSLGASAQNKPIPGETKNLESTATTTAPGQSSVLHDGRHDFDFEIGHGEPMSGDSRIGYPAARIGKCSTAQWSRRRSWTEGAT